MVGPLFFAGVMALGLKGAIHCNAGAATCDRRVEALQQGQNLDRPGGWLMQADPATFFLHAHYAAHPLVLVRAGRIDPDWARARLIRQWRDAAPKRWLKAWEEGQ